MNKEQVNRMNAERLLILSATRKLLLMPTVERLTFYDLVDNTRYEYLRFGWLRIRFHICMSTGFFKSTIKFIKRHLKQYWNSL